MNRRNSGTIVILIFLSALCVLPSDAVAQAPVPSLPVRSGVVQPAAPLPREFKGQQEAFRAYQACVASHRKDVDLHNAAKQIVEFREKREMLERVLQADPKARERVPGGVDEAIARVFAHYKSLGGPARSAAEVNEVPMPCPVPRPDLTSRQPSRGSASISAKKELTVSPGVAVPNLPTAQPARTFTPATSPPLRRALEQAWLAHVIAVGSGMESELQKTMSSYYFATTRNNLARAGRTLTPEHVVALGRFFPDLNTTSFVTVIENGPTAALVHARNSKEVDSTKQPRVEYLFLRFVDEGRGWKVDAFAIINSPKFQANGSPAPFRLPANPSPEYRIDGQIRTAPAPIPVAR